MIRTRPGTPHAEQRVMRPLLALVLLGGCFAIGGSPTSRPAVTPMLSELPADPSKRDAILDQSGQTPGPEHHRRQLPPRMRKAETAAATAAAIIGNMFSSTKNVTIGTQDSFDENTWFAPTPAPRSRPRTHEESEASDQEEPSPGSASPDEDAGALVPWIRLKDR